MKHLIKGLKWHHQNDWCSTKSPTHSYRIHPVNDKFKVIYCKIVDGYAKEATGFTTLEQAKEWAFNHHCEKLSKWLNPDPLTDTLNWFKEAKPEPTNADKTTQIGCNLEEVGEMIEALCGSEWDDLTSLANACKNAEEDESLSFLNDSNKLELLDSLADQIVTAVGVAYMMGFDIIGALKEVNASNWSKFENGKAVTDENGKIIKGSGYFKPELDKFVGGSEND